MNNEELKQRLLDVHNTLTEGEIRKFRRDLADTFYDSSNRPIDAAGAGNIAGFVPALVKKSITDQSK